MSGRVLVRHKASEQAALTGGVGEILTSAAWQQILQSYPRSALDSPDRDVNPLPHPPLLQGPDDGAIFARLIPVLGRYGYRVEVVDAPAGRRHVNGATYHVRRLVQINAGRSPLQQAKTAVHEAAHVARHRRGRPPSRISELRAETCAWLVLHRLGIDSGTFSFPFIAKYGAVRQGAVLWHDWVLARTLRDVSPLAAWVIAQMPAAEAVA